MSLRINHNKFLKTVAALTCVLLIAVGFITAYSFQSTANAAFPKLINFQGKLTAVSNGTNVANGTYTFQFKIYDAPTGGSLLWTETYDQAPVDVCQELQVTSGVFNTKLGSCNPLTIDVTGGDLYLSVNFDPGTGYDGEMTPRKQLVASAFAFNANNVVGDGRIDIAYAPGDAINPGAEINYAPSVASSNNALQVTSGANVTGAALVVTQAGTGLGLDLAGAGGSSRVINSTSSALVLQTTTSGNINLNSAGGTLELQDNTNVTGALTATGVLQGGGATATTYSRLGTASTGHSLSASNDLLISDELEVDGVAYFDGTIDTTFTAGSIVFAGTNGVLAQENAGLFYNDSVTTNLNELGINNTNPAYTLSVHSASEAAANFTTPTSGIAGTDGFYVGYTDSASTAWLWNYENGSISFGTNAAGRMGLTPLGNLILNTSLAEQNTRLYVSDNLSSPSWTTAGRALQFAAATYTDTSGSGTVASRVASSFAQPTFASSSAVTVTDGATLYVANAPANGTNTTITNPYALWIDAGSSRFDGLITGNLGATVLGATTSINDSSNFATNINTGTSAGTVTIGSTTSAQAILLQSGTGDVTITSTDQFIVNTTGTIELQDNTNITGALTTTGVLQGGGATATTYSRLGAGTTTHSLGAADDLLVTDDLEVDGDAFFDGNLTVTGTCTGCGGGSSSLQGAYDGGNTILTASATDIAFTFAANTALTLDAATTDTTETTGVIDLNVDSATDLASAMDVFFRSTGTTAAATNYGVKIGYDPEHATNARTTRLLDIDVSGDTGSLADTIYGAYIDVTTATNTSDTTYAAVFQGGNVGIGDTTPGSMLEINTRSATTTGLIISGFAGQDNNNPLLQLTATPGSAVLGLFDANGRMYLNAGALASFGPNDLDVALALSPRTNSTNAQIIRGVAGHSGAIFSIQDSGTTTNFSVTAAGAVAASGALQGGGTSSVAYSRLGTGTTGHSLGAADDFLVSDDFEVDGDAFFDGNITIAGTCTGCGGGSQTPWTGNIDADNFSLLDLGANVTSRAAIAIGSADNGSGASGAVTLNTGTGTTSTGGLTLVTGNASAGTAGNVSIDVGTSTSSNGSILIGTAARTQTITIGNSTGGTITVGASSGSDLVLNDAQWSVTGAGAAAFASLDVAGVIQAGSSNVDLTDASGFIQHDSLVDCSDTQILKWAAGGGRWGCATDESGGGSSLQAAYGGDVDGSNATISLTTADDSLVFTNPSSSGTDSAFVVQVDQANTTAAVVGLDIVQQSNAANGVNLTANAIDGEVGLNITANALTSGNGLAIASSSTALTGALAKLTLSGSDAANTGSVLRIDNTGTASATTGLYIDHRATGTGNYALRINDVSGDTTPFIVDGDGRVGIGTESISANAATERLLQVGSETRRGNASVYGEIISKGSDEHTPLTGIKDVFVYDTTGDSDGGRWIDWATTDNLSWYAEALDDSSSDPCVIATDDRCYKASFPRKAILVVTTDALYIFDAATNDMWMKFSQNASVYALGADTNNDPSSVFALNGVIYVGANGSSAGGLYAFDFVNDRMWNYNGTNRSAATTGISGRNAAVSYTVESNLKLEISPVGTAAEWERVNDVHAVVMSRTQSAVTALGAATNTNPAYGKVFIGLATDSGITLINPSGFVLHQYSDVTADDYTSVVISSRGFLYALNTTQDQLERWDTIDTDKASEVNGTFSRKWDETIGTGPALASATFNIIAGAPDNLEIAERASNNLNTEDVIYVGHSLGMAELHEHTTQAFGWVKYYNDTRQTPMMMLAGINDMVLPMDDTSGTQAQDLAIANTDMAIVGGPTLGVDGVQGKAINFDNSNDYLCSDANQNNVCDVDTAFNMSTVGWTLSLWFKHSATAPSGAIDTIFEKCVTAAPAQGIGCVIAYMNTSGQIVVANDDDATWTRPDGGGANSYDITATSTYAYNDNQWHNLIISRTNINDVDSWIDGQGMTLSTPTANTITLDGSQIVTLGASCVTTVTIDCGAVTNVWDGAIDDVQFIVGTTTQATMTQLYVRRYFNVERPRVTKKTISVTNATSATSTSLTDTGEAWNANEFAGAIVEITGSDDTDCVGVSRRVSSNTATALTFTPAVPGACTLDTSADFAVDPEALFGGSSSVGGIGISAETPLGEARQMCVGTNSGSDTGAVTCYNHQDGPSLVADVYHSQASQTDNNGTDWTGSNYDEMMAIDLSTRTLVMASEAHFTAITEDVRLGQGLDYVANQLYNIRQEIVLDGITAVGSMGSEIGFTGGADLAEFYYSTQALEPGQVVVIDRAGDGDDVVRSTRAYSGGILGVVSTQPGIILGLRAEDGFPIALTGRIPVKFSMENGPVKAGDYLTSSSIPGYAMRATGAGPTIGKALADSIPEQDMAVCSAHGEGLPDNIKCSEVSVFVEHGNFSGLPIEQLMQEMRVSVSAVGDLIEDSTEGLVEESDEESQALVGTGLDNDIDDSLTTDEKILVFLKHIKAEKVAAGQGVSAELFTDRVSAAFEVISPQVTTSGLRVEVIGKLGGIIDMLSDVTFFGRPYLNNDTAGFAIIKEGHTTVDVKFDKEYIEQPVVVASIAGELDSEIIKAGDVERIKEIQKLQDDLAIELFEQGIQALVIKKNVFGFTILLNKPAPKDVSLSWIALAVKNPKIFESEGLTEEVADETESNPEVLGENTSSEEQESSEGNSESSNEDASPQEETIVEEQSPPAEEPSPPAEEQPEQSPPPSEESPPPSE